MGMAMRNMILKLVESRPQDFTMLVKLHLKNVHKTIDIEESAIQLINLKFEPKFLSTFIYEVHKWGGDRYNTYKAVQENALPAHYLAAMDSLRNEPNRVDKALACLQVIPQLGISYASKHLRFLSPEFCSILDSNVAKIFRYDQTAEGYQQLCQDSLEAAKILEKRNIQNPMGRLNGRWFAADIEMAIFAQIQYDANRPGYKN
jgi:hypothetical protein